MRVISTAGCSLLLAALFMVAFISNATPEAGEGSYCNQSNARGPGFSTVLIPVEEIDLSDRSNIIIDISPRSAEYIPGAISIPYDRFVDPGGRLEPISQMAGILGKAGISKNDSIIIYGECQPCGGGPSAATYVFWILKYLGHEDVRLLDGGIDDWVVAAKPTASEPAILPPKAYTPAVDSDLLAKYEFVKSGLPQIIDARPDKDFEARSIPGAINIPYTSVMDGKRIRNQSELKELFRDLQKNRSVVVYTNTGIKASMIWLPLNLLGYDAKIYTMQDWTADHSQLNIDLEEAKADPNPTPSKGAVNITVLIKKNDGSAGDIDGESSSGRRIESASGEQTMDENGTYSLRVLLRSERDDQLHQVLLEQISDNKYAGSWIAGLSGTYDVGIIATRNGINKIFLHALQIEVK